MGYTVCEIRHGHTGTFNPIPTALHERAAEFKFSDKDRLLIIELLSYKWTRANCFPSVETLATRLGWNERTVQRVASSLEKRGFLRRIPRRLRPNEFDLSGLFEKLNTPAPANSCSLQGRDGVGADDLPKRDGKEVLATITAKAIRSQVLHRVLEAGCFCASINPNSADTWSDVYVLAEAFAAVSEAQDGWDMTREKMIDLGAWRLFYAYKELAAAAA
jgi:hypothetical protein